MPKPWFAGLAALALLGPPHAASARPFTVEDLLHQETFRGFAVDPSGRWLVYERTEPYLQAGRFDYDQQSRIALSRLKVVDLAHSGPARSLVTLKPGAGAIMGPFSPSGRRLAIYRLRGDRWSLGVVTLATRDVIWLPVTPEQPMYGRTLQWIDDDRLVVIDRPDGLAPFALRQGRISADRLPALWAASAKGVGAHAIQGSGAYASARPRPPPGHLVLIDLAHGARRVLAAGEFFDLELSPTRDRLALLAYGEDLQSRPEQPSQGARGIETQRAVLSILDLKTGRRGPAAEGRDMLPNLLAWSPDGASLLVFDRDPSDLWSNGQLSRVDAATGEARPVGPGLRPVLELRPEIVHAGWMGTTPLVLATPDAGAIRADWYRLDAAGPVNLTRGLPTAPRQISASDATHLVVTVNGVAWRIDDTGRAQMLAGDPVSALGETLPMAGRLSHAPQATSLARVGPAGRRDIEVLDANGLHPTGAVPVDDDPVAAISLPERTVITRHLDKAGVATLRLQRAGKPARAIDTINRDLADVDPAEIVAVHHQGPDGQALTSWMFLPRTAPEGPPPPVVIAVYSGDTYRVAPRPNPPERDLLTDPRALVGHGYAVLFPSLPMPRDTEPMAGLADRILGVVSAAGATPALAGRVDLTRVALWGHSYGGYTVMAAIGQTRRFVAAVSIAGLSDLTAMWSTLPVAHRVAPEEGSWSNWNTGNTESGQNRMGQPPWADPALYDRNSPLLAADHIHTPLLLMHGDQDLIPLSGSEALFSALYRQNKDAMLVTYWGEGHIFASPGNVRDVYARAFAFLDEHFATRPKAAAAETAPNPERGPASAESSTPSSPPTGSAGPPPPT